MKVRIQNQISKVERETFVFTLSESNQEPYLYLADYIHEELSPVTNIWQCFACVGRHCPNEKSQWHQSISKQPNAVPKEIKDQAKAEICKIINELKLR